MGPNLIICEGKSDEFFFRHILKNNGISSFQVEHPNDTTAEGHYGHSGFLKYLQGIKARSGYKDIRNIIIARDSDLDPDRSFNEVRGQIRKANGYEVPDHPRVAKGKNPAMSVLLIPGSNELGNLETLLLKAVTYDQKSEACFDNYFACMGFKDLPITILSKKKMTTIVAAMNDKNPSCSLAYIWSQEYKKYNLISIQKPAIRDIVEFLRSFSG